MKPFVALMAGIAVVASVGACNDATTPQPVVEPPVTPVAPTAAHMYAMYPLSMLGFVGSPVYPEPRVRVGDDQYKPIAGVRVVFEVRAGGGSLGKNEVLTGDDGTAGVDFWKLGSSGVVNTLVATVGNLSVEFTAYGLNPDEEPVARYDLASVNGRPVPYASGWNDLDAITDMGGTLELYQQYFVETFRFDWVYGDGKIQKQYVAGTYTKSNDGIRLENVNVDALLRGDSLIVGPQKMPDEFVAPTVYLKRKQ